MFFHICLFFLLHICGADFTEDLLLSPLPDGRILAHFHFDNNGGLDSSNYELFPKSLGSILHKYGVEEMSLSLSHGRWQHREWGYPSDYPILNTSLSTTGPVIGPSGAEVWASLTPTNQRGATNSLEISLQSQWVSLLHALAGIFCSSLNTLDSSRIAHPSHLSHLPTRPATIFYGTLQAEAVIYNHTLSLFILASNMLTHFQICFNIQKLTFCSDMIYV